MPGKGRVGFYPPIANTMKKLNSKRNLTKKKMRTNTQYSWRKQLKAVVLCGCLYLNSPVLSQQATDSAKTTISHAEPVKSTGAWLNHVLIMSGLVVLFLLLNKRSNATVQKNTPCRKEQMPSRVTIINKEGGIINVEYLQSTHTAGIEQTTHGDRSGAVIQASLHDRQQVAAMIAWAMAMLQQEKNIEPVHRDILLAGYGQIQQQLNEHKSLDKKNIGNWRMLILSTLEKVVLAYHVKEALEWVNENIDHVTGFVDQAF